MFDNTPFHPMLVHFPIALLITGFLFDLSGLALKKEWLTRGAVVLLILGTLGAVAAKVSGEAEEDRILVSAELEEHLEDHEDAGSLAMWTFVVLAAARVTLIWFRKFNPAVAWVFILAWLAGVILVGRAAALGGDMVYEHGAGVALEQQGESYD